MLLLSCFVSFCEVGTVTLGRWLRDKRMCPWQNSTETSLVKPAAPTCNKSSLSLPDRKQQRVTHNAA